MVSPSPSREVAANFLQILLVDWVVSGYKLLILDIKRSVWREIGKFGF